MYTYRSTASSAYVALFSRCWNMRGKTMLRLIGLGDPELIFMMSFDNEIL